MSTAEHVRHALLLCTALCVLGCEEEPKPEPAKPAAPAVTTPPPAPTPTASAPPAPREDCPESSTGAGTFDKPCEATGAERMMEVTWTKKVDDKGPAFRVINKSKDLTILYGKIVTYFYDKTGKQLDAAGAAEGKTKRHQDCGGNIFSGVMKPGEKAVITFSCVKQSHVPEGTDSIEAEMQMVGFADEEGKKNEFYWKNADLTPEERPKGGIKPAKTAKGAKSK